MGIGLADPSVIDRRSRDALEQAADLLRDEWFDEACRTPAGGVIAHAGWMAQTLPTKHRPRYTRGFARDYLGALYVVLDRLADRSNEAPICGCTAQELAFRALIDTAADLLDGADESLRSFYEARVFDTDIDLLFDAQLDGIEDPALHVGTVPPDNLEFSRWFIPFRRAWPSVGDDAVDEE